MIEKEEKVSLSKEEYDRLLKKAKEFEEIREKLLRSAADYDNAKKRLAKEREEFIKFSQEKLLRDLLPTLDNFERALKHSEEADPSASSSPIVIAGVQQIWKQLLDLLAAHGLRRFSSEGEPFDPHFHEAVEEVEEEGPEGIVAKEIVGGYLLHDRVFRPAKVRIRASKGRRKKAEEKEEEIT